MDAELVVKAMALGYRVKQVPVVHYPRTWGRATGISLRNLYATGKELLRLKRLVRRMKEKQPPG